MRDRERERGRERERVIAEPTKCNAIKALNLIDEYLEGNFNYNLYA